MKPDRIQITAPVETETPWTVSGPGLTKSYEFESFSQAALFGIYVEEIAGEVDGAATRLCLVDSTLTIKAKPTDSDQITNAAYELAALVDAAVAALEE
ncbi:MAG TPA: hypothetical protein VGG06_33855 [Thermoanaerobaculia bacterium]